MAGAVVPFGTGFGIGVRTAAKAQKAVRLANISASLKDILVPAGKALGKAGESPTIREIQGGFSQAEALFKQLSKGGKVVPDPRYPGTRVVLETGDTVGLRTRATRSPGTAATIDINVKDVPITKLKFNEK